MLKYQKKLIFFNKKKEIAKFCRILILGSTFMKIIDEEKLNEIRTSVDIVDIIGSYLPLAPKGKNFFGVCPFHDDKNPSMSVSREKQIYTCFSCGATGNVFKFVMDYENISFLEAVKIIADASGIVLDITNHKSNFEVKYHDLYEMYNISKKFYQNNINTESGKKAKEYLAKRNINDEIIHKFEIGYALKEHDLLYKMFQKKGFETRDMLNSGLINKNDYGYNDLFYNRIMFPLYNLNGQVVGYSGRIFDNDDTAKYVNTKETVIFKKGELLYNYHRAKEAVKKTKSVIVMEGFMDVIRASSIGLDNVVASMGTAITKNQALLLKKLAPTIILCFDGDQAGLKATIACMNELVNIGVIPQIIRLKDNLDPDEFISKYGKDAFLEILDNPTNMIDFKIECLKNDKNLNNSSELANYVNEIIGELNKINDDVLKEITLKKISNETGLELDFLKSKITKRKSKTLVKKTNLVKRNKYMKAESYLLYYMLQNKEVIKKYERQITYMPTDRYRYLAREIDSFYHNYQTINVADLISYLGNNQMLIDTVGEIISLELKDDCSLEEIDDYIKTIREYNVNYECDRLTKMMNKEMDSEKKALIAKQIIELKMKEWENDK